MLKRVCPGRCQIILLMICMTSFKKGAYGAKLCGAGGGGFFLVLASEAVMTSLKKSLPNSTISRINIDYEGLVRSEI